ncbi:hypothetical protein CDAR_168641 [Caerostris darwini]|uniref:Uncharacterized protein n=1 Tax=Caerostris darwini TaxID=1538125 RepID=A0AAV4T2Y6_9ARAC|nr:hypothetical protein CDAR_168641 [Caerostris darwini]
MKKDQPSKKKSRYINKHLSLDPPPPKERQSHSEQPRDICRLLKATFPQQEITRKKGRAIQNSDLYFGQNSELPFYTSPIAYTSVNHSSSYQNAEASNPNPTEGIAEKER